VTNQQFAAWRARHFRSRRACAQALGIDPRTIRAFEAGRAIPAHVILACAAWTLGLRGYDGGAVTIG